MKLRSLLLAAAAALLAAMPALPQQAASRDPVYTVELIVFRATTALGAPESWSTRPVIPTTTTGDTAGSPAGEPAAAPAADPSTYGRFVSAVPPSQLQLQDIARRLRASGAYEPVAHVAWSQTASPWGTRAGFAVERLGIDVPGLTGTISLERGQYLHLTLALDFAMPDPPAGLGAGAGTVFTLNQSRRVRFYERNYYDHPAFGVIALVTPAPGSRPAGR